MAINFAFLLIEYFMSRSLVEASEFGQVITNSCVVFHWPKASSVPSVFGDWSGARW